jgi:hypothetical protein
MAQSVALSPMGIFEAKSDNQDQEIKGLLA